MRWLFALVMVIVLSSMATAQEWTRFRGPNGLGINDKVSIPAAWGEKEVSWKVELPGEGHSSPVLWGDKLFILSGNRQTAERFISCLSAADGKQIWQKSVACNQHPLHSKSSYANTTCAVEADRVYAAFGSLDATYLVAFDHAGEQIWKIDIGGWVGQHGFGTSPMIVGDVVVITSSQEDQKRENSAAPNESFVIGVNKKTGAILWKTPRKIDTTSYSVPCLRKGPGGDELVMCTTAEGFFALNPLDGKEIWSTDPVFDKRTVSSPLLLNDMLFGTCGSGGGGNYVVALKFEPVPKMQYEVRKEAPYVPTPAIKDDLMFLWGDGGVVTCIEWSTGKQVWQRRVGGKYSSSPVVDKDKVFCADEDGNVVVLAADRQYKLLAKNELGELCYSTPAIAQGQMFVRTLNHLVAIRGEQQ
jgi:outer membrane protein assembly factor BamB